MRILSLLFFLVYALILNGQGNSSIIDLESKADVFLITYVENGFVNYKTIKSQGNDDLEELTDLIANIDLTQLKSNEQKSFYINAYNLLVIDQIVKVYPTNSVKEINGFFDRNKFQVGKRMLSLNELEKDILLKQFEDSRLHFALICGAIDCPKIWNRAFTSDNLEKELDDRTKASLNDSSFLKKTDKGYGLSEIFKWNRFEFGGKSDMINFINRYRDEQIESDSKIYYYDYNWILNDTKFEQDEFLSSGNNAFRYVTSAAIPKGGIEVKLFNNLYTQKEGDGQVLNRRSTYFTSSLSFLYGKTNRFNVGFTTRYRRVRNSNLPSSALKVFESGNIFDSKQGFTAFGPQIRWAPFKSLSNFSIQSSLTFPLSKGLSGGIDEPFLDWSGPVFLTQFFNDKSIGDQFSLFTEIDLLIEEIGGSGKSNRVSTPITAILSWFPKKNVTLYGLLGYSPYIVKPYDYFTQAGLGLKYQMTRNFELELLYTDFSNKYLNSINGQAATYNLGFRYSH